MSSSDATSNSLILKGGVSALYGARIIVSDLASPKESKQVRFPRSKRKRIRRKWEKDRRNWVTTSKPGIWKLADGSFVMDPASYAKLQESLKEAPLIRTTLPPPFTMEGFLDDLRSITRPLVALLSLT